MIIGVPREVKDEESRVALTPSGVGAFVAHGHSVVVEHGAGEGSSLRDALYRDAGATLTDAAGVWERAELLLKVKEPIAVRVSTTATRDDALHVPPPRRQPELTKISSAERVRALAYETLQLADGRCRCSSPMSEIAGRLATQVGAWCLEAQNGGARRPALRRLAGTSGQGRDRRRGHRRKQRLQGGRRCGAYVSILDVDPGKLRYVHDILGGHVTTVMSNRANLEEEDHERRPGDRRRAHPGAKAPRLISRDLVAAMRPVPRSSISPSTRVDAPRRRVRPRTRIRSIATRTSCTMP
jgi:alanine dehydrogenase